jgi:glycosyltransferase involved in cell wall biosynthesis
MARARALRTPYVLTFHGGGSSLGWRNRIRASQRRVQRPLYAAAGRLVAIAQFELEQYARELGLGRDHFALIPNGSDITAPTGSNTPSAPVARDAPVTIASIGRLERYKGHHRAIAALPALLRRRPGARLLIVGQGPYEAELRATAAVSGAADRIEFTSVAPEDAGGMTRLLKEVDLVVLMSEFETHPIVALEAAAMRRRLVVADVSGLAELAAHGFAHPVALDLSPELIAEVVDRELARPGPATAPDPFTWDDCTSALLGLYEQTVARA